MGAEVDRPWSLADYGVAAHHLGEFNGAYLARRRPLPTAAWLTKGRIRDWLAFAQPATENLDNFCANPLLRPYLPEHAVAQIQQRWTLHEPLLALMDTLPRTLCHHDAFRLNLAVRQGINGQPTQAYLAQKLALIDFYVALGNEACQLYFALNGNQRQIP